MEDYQVFLGILPGAVFGLVVAWQYVSSILVPWLELPAGFETPVGILFYCLGVGEAGAVLGAICGLICINIVANLLVRIDLSRVLYDLNEAIHFVQRHALKRFWKGKRLIARIFNSGK
jgi:hypothetical protein